MYHYKRMFKYNGLIFLIFLNSINAYFLGNGVKLCYNGSLKADGKLRSIRCTINATACIAIRIGDKLEAAGCLHDSSLVPECMGELHYNSYVPTLFLNDSIFCCAGDLCNNLKFLEKFSPTDGILTVKAITILVCTSFVVAASIGLFQRIIASRDNFLISQAEQVAAAVAAADEIEYEITDSEFDSE